MRERHITKVAKALIARYKIGLEAVIDPRDPSEPSISYLCGHSRTDIVVMWQLNSMKPETLGRIAAQGLSFTADLQNKTSMMLAGEALGATPKMLSGKRQLVHLAATALLAEMFDILRKQIEPSATELESFRQLEPFLLKKS